MVYVAAVEKVDWQKENSYSVAVLGLSLVLSEARNYRNSMYHPVVVIPRESDPLV